MTDLGSLAQQTADQLAGQGAGMVVGVVADGAVEIRVAGRSGVVGAGTVFEIGSVTKLFTALTLARLVVAGTVGLDEPLRDLLPAGAVVPSRGGAQITLRQLATHTSGLPRLPRGLLLSAFLRGHSADPYVRCTADSLLRGLARTRLDAVPGERFHYSNLGAGLLGLALARRAGTDYESLVAREVCAPLGLADTGILLDADRSARLAQGHGNDGRPVPAWQFADLAGAGGLRSTVADLVTFVRAQLDGGAGELAEAIRVGREVRHETGEFSWVHLGWMGHQLNPAHGSRVQLWHNGGTGGFSSFVGFEPERSVAVVVLSDSERFVDEESFALLRTLGAGGPFAEA